MSSTLAVLGGLFDPVHKGHVRVALHAFEQLAVERLVMVPCHVPNPNHKAPSGTAPEHRLAMLKIATAAYPQIEIDPIELQRDSVSYTVDTLRHYKQLHDTVVFILGVDAFNALPQWHDWQAILDLSHLFVVSRPGTGLKLETQKAVDMERRRVSDGGQLLTKTSGNILTSEGLEYDMASSEIRNKLARGEDVSTDLDAEVIRYIDTHELYRKL